MDTDTLFRRIVVGIDGSAASLDALDTAAAIAAAHGSRLEALAACEPLPLVDGYLPTELPAPLEDARRILDDAIAATFPDGPPAGLVLTPREGNAARMLLDASAEADLLVVGRRGHGAIASLLLGSVSAACTAHADCDVLVVRRSRTEGSR